MSRDVPMILDAETADAPVGDLMMSVAGFRHAKELAEFMAKAEMLPANFRGKPADVLMALNLAQRMGEDPFTVMQSIHFVQGRPGFSAAFLIARANMSGVFRGPLEFDTVGEGTPDLAVTCSAVLSGSGKAVSSTVSLAMAHAEGWARKNADKYRNLPVQMLSYRAATFLVRLYAPQVMFGLRPVDELEDIHNPVAVERVRIEPERPTRRTALPIDPPRQIAEVPTPTATDAIVEPVTASESTAVDSVAPTATPARPTTWKEGDDDSWEPSRVRFCIDVRELKLGHDNEIVFDYAEEATQLKKRPRQMTMHERAGFLKHLRSEAGRSRLADYVVERTEREAQAEGEPEGPEVAILLHDTGGAE